MTREELDAVTVLEMALVRSPVREQWSIVTGLIGRLYKMENAPKVEAEIIHFRPAQKIEDNTPEGA